MHPKARKAAILASSVLLASAVARAQPVDPIGALLDRAALPAPSASPGPATAPGRLAYDDQRSFSQALSAARRGAVSEARAAVADLRDPLARKTALWALVDANAESLGFYEVDQARRDLTGWPRPGRRQAAAERRLEGSGLSPRQVIDWFAGAEPQTAQGAMALAGAHRMLGQDAEARTLIRRWWRDRSFEADAQRAMLARFGDALSVEDHIRRADILLYGAQGPAAREMLALLPADHQAAAQARIALRANAADAAQIADALPAGLATSPGVAFERAAFLRRRGLDSLAMAQLPFFPREIATPEHAERMWDERVRLLLTAVRNGDHRAAYAASANSGLTTGSDAADAEFFAGWVALTRLKDPASAARHFASLGAIGSSPITRARASYWQGRAAEAQGAQEAAEAHYEAGARHTTTFYGQLAAEKLGRSLILPKDPTPTPQERARFEGDEVVRAARLLAENDQRDLFRVFALHLDDTVPTVVDAALLVDMIRGYGDQDTSMKAVRAAAQRGLILVERGYPVRTPPAIQNAPELALVMGITRQESGFDPLVRSPVGARGMMQLMPATAQIVARRLGVNYAPSLLDDPDYNMRLGSTFLGQLVSQFSGSYVMAIAGYNAGPGRPVQWSAFCGDPRGGGTDPIDFIECIPFSETRNYVMRVMEGAQVYRARLNGGQAPITLSQDLRRGAYAGPSSSVAAAAP